jgi:hypothetical protein
VGGCGVNFEKSTNIISPQIYYVVSKQTNNIILYMDANQTKCRFFGKKRKKKRQKVINAHKVQFLLDELGS